MVKVLGTFSLLAIAIAGMGVFALGLHTVERRGREIGVRRVLGVSARSIVVLLTGEFTGLVLTASLVVCPLIYLAMNHWLDQFAYRQDPGLFVFFASGIAVLLVTWLTVGGQALQTALRNPVQALRQD